MNKTLIPLVLCCLLSNGVQAKGGLLGLFSKKQSPTEKTEKPKQSDYDKLFREKHDIARGMITLHKVKDKLYFEFPDSLFGREMLLGSTISEISDNASGTIGSKSGYPRHVLFTKSEGFVQMRDAGQDAVTDGKTSKGLEAALKKNSLPPILENFKIEAWNKDSSAVVINVTELFLGDQKEMSPFSDYGMYSGYDVSKTFARDRSQLGEIKAFSDNVVVRSTLSYTFSVRYQKATLVDSKPLSAVMTRTLVLLDREPYRPRIVDSRMAIFPTGKYLFSGQEQKVKVIYYANRWRVEPSDMEAWKRGETVSAKKPIVFYVDPDFPEMWKKYIFEAVDQWKEPFEKIGISDAVMAKNYPTDDPEFDPDNIKYSCIRYAPIQIGNAMGPSWVDPRSGEILNASVYVYHDVIKLLNNWMFIQTAQADKRVRSVTIPEEVIGDGLRYVLAHEVGHCLGFMHNMSASATIPVDSLRSPSFTQKHGTTTCIMDYARFNYVAQPGDFEKGVRMSPPRFGDYDYFAVKWSYTPVPEAATAADEYKVTSGWITDAAANPVLRYGKQQLRTIIDPKSQTEDLGDDAVKASEYGIGNLKYILAHLDQWLSEGDGDFKHRGEIYDGIIMQYYRYINHVFANVGGIYLNEKMDGDPVKAFESVPAEKQRRAVKFLLAQLRDMEWLDNTAAMKNQPIIGSPRSTLLPILVNAVVAAPDKVALSAKTAEGEAYTPEQCRRDIYDAIWEPTLKGRKLTDADMMLQREYVRSLCSQAGLRYTGTGAQKAKAITDGGGLEMPEFLKPVADAEKPLTVCCGADHDPYRLSAGQSPVSGYASPSVKYFTPTVDEGANYAAVLQLQSMLRGKAAGAPAQSAAHYRLLLHNIEKTLAK